MRGIEIVPACDRHSNETVTLRKLVIKYKHMLIVGLWMSMAEFFRKPLSPGIKITQVYSFVLTNLSIYFNFLRAVASR